MLGSSDNMSWFEQLKMVPRDKFSLGYVIVNAAETEKAVKEIKNLTKPPQALKSLLLSIENNQLSLEELKETFGQPPHGDQTLEQMRENVQKIKNASKLLTLSEVRELIKEAFEAKRNTNPQKVKEILQNLDENADLSKRTLQRHRDIRDSLDILRMSNDKSVIMFENPPSDKKILEEFAKLLDGEVVGDTIAVNFKSQSEFIAAMVPKKEDSDAIKEKKSEIKEMYNKHFRKSGWSLSIGQKTVDLNNLVAQKKIFVASGQKLEVVEPFTGASVLKYIRAVDKVTGSVRAFRPKKLPNGSTVPKVLFLDKASPNSMNLNPYAKLILTSDFSGDEWFKTFFDVLRTNQMLSEKDAEQLIIQEIYETLMGDKNTTPSGLSVSTFRGADGIQDLETKTPKKVRAEIRQIISDSARLEDTIINAGLALQQEQLQYLEGNFTLKEAADFKKFYESLDREDFPLEDLEIEYFKDGRPTKYESDKVDEEGNQVRDESGAIVTQTLSGIERANYATIKIEGETLSPEDAYEFGLKVTSPEFTEESTKRTEKTIDTMNASLNAAKTRLAKVPKDKADLRERLQTKISNLEERIKNAKSKITEGKDKTDIGQQTAKLRNELLNMDDFSQYLIATSNKLKGEGGLIGLVSKIERSASALEQITPERSLGFFAQLDEHAGNNDVREAFKVIDDKPESDEAKDAAKELNDKMPNILSNAKEQLIGAFKLHLEKFAKNPASFPDNQVISAKKQFVDKQNLLTLGE
jgi:hypothetical protein